MGSDGKGITSITKTGTSGLTDTYTITYSDNTTSTFEVKNGAKGDKGNKGDTGATGKGISSIAKTGTSGLVDTYTITYSDSTTSTFQVTNGQNGTNGTNGADGEDGNRFWTTTTAPTTPNYTFTIANLTGETGETPKKGDIIFYSYYRYTVDTVSSTTLLATPRQSIRGGTGATGKGITSITKTGTSGLVDTYTITYSDSTTSTFTVTNGSDATVVIATAWNSTTSDSKVPSEKLVKNSLDDKISKSSTSGLMKNDGTVDTNAYITSASLPTKTSDLTNDGSDGINAFVPSNDSRLSDVRNPKNNTVSATSTDLKDLDDYVDVGFYNFFNNDTIQYVSNKPSGVTYSFFLLVEARSNGNQAKQTLTEFYTNKTFVRTKIESGRWNNWKEIVDKSYVDNLVGSAIIYINQ